MEIIKTPKILNIFKSRRKLKKWSIRLSAAMLIVCLVLFSLVKLNVIKIGSPSASRVQQNTTQVSKGSISETLSGSGTIYSADMEELTPLVSGTITKLAVKEGDQVKKGDLIYEMDDSDAQTSLEQLKNNLLQAQLSAQTTTKEISSLNMKAPFDGQVTAVNVKVGDDVQKGGTIMTLKDTSHLRTTVQFNGALQGSIKLGQSATVNIQNLMESIEGTVTYIGKKAYSTEAGGTVFNVDVTVKNPGSLYEGMSVSVEVKTGNETESSVNEGNLEYVASQVMKSDAGGTVKSVSIRVNDSVKAGEILYSIQNDDLTITNLTNQSKIQDLENQVKNAEKKIGYYKVYAPIDGLVVSVKSKVGDTVGPSNGSSAVVPVTLIDNKNFKFDVAIDELDIEKIKTGQKVNVTVDAISSTAEKPLEGEVVNAALQGTSSNGVSSYPVTIQIKDAAALKAGMNATGEIMINQKSDVLKVPLEAIQKMGTRNMVWVMGTGTGEKGEGFGSGRRSGTSDTSGSERQGSSRRSGNKGNGSIGAGNFPVSNFATRRNSSSDSNTSDYYHNARLKAVETGISNDEYIEIVSGLAEGETVILPATNTVSSSTTTTNSTNRNRESAGGFGGGFGGPPN